MTVMSVNSYQFNNLIQQQVPFLLFNMVETEIAPPWTRAFERAIKVQSYSEIESKIRELAVDLQYPLVLCCDRGSISQEHAHKLVESGHINVYVVADGMQGLLRVDE